jgi:hypothetical protein
MRIRCRFAFAVMIMCLPAMISGGNLTTTIALQNVYPIFILCNDVPAASCNPSAPLPLIHTENEGSWPAFPSGAQDTFKNINFSSLWSGYMTYLALPQ